MAYTTFISHSVSPGDYSLVTTIANLLWQRGVQTYIPEVYPAEGTLELIEAQVKESDAVLLVVTRDTVRSAWVTQEVGFARGAGKWVMPLVQRGVNPEPFLQDLRWLEFDRPDLSPMFEKVAAYLRDQAGNEDVKRAEQAGLVSAAVLGLGLWLLSQHPVPAA